MICRIPLLTFCFAFLLIGCFDPENQANSQTVSTQPIDTLHKEKNNQIDVADTFAICAVGDMMLGSGFPKGHLPPHDGTEILEPVKAFLKGDIVFGNLEGCFADSGRSDKCGDLTGNSCFAFRMPTRYGKYIQSAGFNIVSIANNHINDYGVAGRKTTMQILDSLKITYAGVSDVPYSIVKVKNRLVAFTAFAPNQNTQSLLDVASAIETIKLLKTKSDLVVVSFHGGAEGAKYQHVKRKMEYFYGEKRGDVYDFAHKAIDAGADIVIGHGPHVTRGSELYNKKLIMYSLGNFCTYGQFSLNGPNAVAPIIQAQLDGNGDFLQAKVISIKQTKSGGPFQDKEGTAFKYLKNLSKTDFPESKLVFENSEIKIRN